MATETPLLELRDIRVHYGKVEALKGVSLVVGHGEVVALIGANGAGKTTTLKTISGVRPVTSGSILLEGKDISGVPAHARAKLGIAQAPEGRRIFPGMTVLENLEMGTYGQKGAKERIPADLERVFGLFPRLAERRRQAAGTLSGGEQQMVAMGRAMIARPKLLLLDEPSMGLAPLMVEKVFDVVRTIASEGVTILLIEQNARLALENSHRGYVMESGEITLSGPARDMLHDPKVRAAYLGEVE